jgi:hypothetical protein
MPILVMGAVALGIFGLIGIMLFTASAMERKKKTGSRV